MRRFVGDLAGFLLCVVLVAACSHGFRQVSDGSVEQGPHADATAMDALGSDTTGLDGGHDGSIPGGDGGACAAPCMAGETRCSGGMLTTCIFDGECFRFDAGEPCAAGQSCVGDRCGESSLEITADMELCGDQVYAGSFSVVGGARVTCSTGELTIRAETIFVDPSSSIDLSASSDETNGAANAGLWASGSGGGYGTAGQPGYDRSASSSQVAAPAFGSSFDAVVHAGVKGGNGCSPSSNCYMCAGYPAGGKGGGALRLFARTKITILGSVLSEGGDGRNTYHAAGGGSGGGILLSAPEVETGPSSQLSVAEGQGGTEVLNANCGGYPSGLPGGRGGAGRIKILHGGDVSLQGTTSCGYASCTTVYSVSVMPPSSFASPTHPDPAKYYHPTFSSADFSWAKPYAAAKAFYYLLTQEQYPHPRDEVVAHGVFTSIPDISIPKSSLSPLGSWYLHVLTVHDDDLPGQIYATYPLVLKDQVIGLSSDTHPSQDVWYSDPIKKEPAFTIGSNPSIDGSVKGYWYRLDRSSTAQPGKVAEGWTFTPAGKFTVSTDAEGASLIDGAYYLHLVAEDSMGNLTTTVRHHRILLGSEPAKSSFFGYVKDATGASLTGVKISLEPFGLVETTDANGYFLFDDLYVGTYALLATLAGYQPSSETIAISDTPMSKDFALSQ